MKLYLSSFKLGNETNYLKNWISEHDNKILLIPNARDDKEKDEKEKGKIKSNIRMLEEIGFKVSILDLKNYFKSNNLAEDIKDFNAFCAIGGNVFVLREAMKLSGFDEYLKSIAADKGKIYIGYSAGSAVLSKKLNGLHFIDDPINIYNEDGIPFEGLGLIDFCFLPHYQSHHKETKLVDLAIEYMERHQLKYKAIRDGEVLKINCKPFTNDRSFWDESYYRNLSDETTLDYLEEAWMEKYEDIINNCDAEKVINVGCGLGQDSMWFYKHGFDVLACDISSLALEKLKGFYPSIKRMLLDVSDGLPFENNFAGIVNANLSLHYFTISKTKEIFDEIYDVLEKGGLFIGRMNSDKNVIEGAKEIEKGFYYTEASGYSRLFDREQWDELTGKWEVILLKETETVRLGKTKYVWEFILRK